MADRDAGLFTGRRFEQTLADPLRFQRLFADMALVGATPGGGVHRLAASAEDGAARDILRNWFAALGLRALVDAVGNMAGVLELAGPDAPVVMVGSHLDSQPYGGRFDGALGVVAAVAAAVALRDGARTGALAARNNLVVTNWTNEEGARFQPSLLGSAVFTGGMSIEAALAQRDRNGDSLGSALAAIGYAGSETLPPPAAYLELHIECGPILHDAGVRLGVFSQYWGTVKQRVAFIGAQAHTGPTPMSQRRDALLGAAHMVAALWAMADAAPGLLHTSAGRIDVSPNSPNTVAAQAVLFVELRSPKPEVLAWAEAELSRQAEQAAFRAGVAFACQGVERRPAGRFDARLFALFEAEAAAMGVNSLALATVPGHDAISLAQICPTAMLVVPSVGGISHHVDEFTETEDLVLATEVLTRVLWRLCEAPLA